MLSEIRGAKTRIVYIFRAGNYLKPFQLYMCDLHIWILFSGIKICHFVSRSPPFYPRPRFILCVTQALCEVAVESLYVCVCLRAFCTFRYELEGEQRINETWHPRWTPSCRSSLVFTSTLFHLFMQRNWWKWLQIARVVTCHKNQDQNMKKRVHSNHTRVFSLTFTSSSSNWTKNMN